MNKSKADNNFYHFAKKINMLTWIVLTACGREIQWDSNHDNMVNKEICVECKDVGVNNIHIQVIPRCWSCSHCLEEAKKEV